MNVGDFISKMFHKAGGPEAVKDQLVLEIDPTSNYHRRRRFYSQEITLDELPIFTIWRARQMMYDPQVKIGMDTRNAALLQAEVEIESSNPAVVEWLQRQFDFLWNHHFEKLVRAKRYGYASMQIDWNEVHGLAEISNVKEFDPVDSRALTHEGSVVGFRVRRSVSLLAPRALWLTFNSEFGQFYGDPILRSAYSPWWEKYMDRGYKNTLQVRMLKDAARGDRLGYPENKTFTTPDGDQISMRNVARELVENVLSSGTMVLPTTTDDKGNPEWTYDPPQDTGNPEGIFGWGSRLDLEIWKAIGVFPEVIEAAETGSGFSGRSVPFILFVSSTQVEFNEILRGIDAFIFNPGVIMNFGKDAKYKIKSRPLVETFAQDISGTALGGGAIGGQQGDRNGQGEPIPVGPKPTPVRETQSRGRAKFLTAGQFDEDGNEIQFDAGPTDSTSSNADEIIEIGSAANRKALRTKTDKLLASLKKKRQSLP